MLSREVRALFVKQITVRAPEQFQGRKLEKGSEGERQLEKHNEKYFVCQKS